MTNRMGMVETNTEDDKRKFKCYAHNFFTDDGNEYQDHLMNPKLSHIEVFNNGICFYCGERFNAGPEEKVEYRHFATGKATHRKCRQKMAQELNESESE